MPRREVVAGSPEAQVTPPGVHCLLQWTTYDDSVLSVLETIVRCLDEPVVMKLVLNQCLPKTTL
jgi:hypothetical protein